jgi:RNA polymerase sigma factor (sigma-70 family)
MTPTADAPPRGPFLPAAERAELVRKWDRLVHAKIRQFAAGTRRRGGPDYEDLAQEGRLALVRAAARFDPALGWQFQTLAGRCVEHAILSWLRGRRPRGYRSRPGAGPAVVQLSAYAYADGDPVDLADGRPAPDPGPALDAAAVLELAADVLTPRQLEALAALGREGLAGRAAGRRLGLSGARARFLQARAARKLRERLGVGPGEEW